MSVNGFVVRRSAPLTAEEIVQSKDGMVRFKKMLQQGSVNLCRAILESGKLHGAMTEKQQMQSISYAYDVGVAYVESQS